MTQLVMDGTGVVTRVGSRGRVCVFQPFDKTSSPVNPPSNRSPFDLGVVIGRVAEAFVPEAEGLTSEIQSMTGWSDRTIATALGTTHPTVGKLLTGGKVRSEIRQRVVPVHDLISRIYALVEGDPTAVDRVIRAKPDPALDLLNIGEISKAYLRAVEEIRPRRTTGLMIGSRPRKQHGASVPLFDED